MKKAYVIAVLSVLVLLTMVIWMSRSWDGFQIKGILMIGIQLVIVVFALFVVYKRIKSNREDLPAEDEMSKSILKRGAASSYYISLYLWLGIMFFEESIELERSSLIGAGILGMAVIYGLSWLYHNYFKREP